MDILYISYDGLTDNLGQSQILPYLKGCSKEHRFTIISFEKAQNFIRNESIIRKSLEESSINWIPLSYTKNPPVLSTFFDLWKLRSQIAKTLKESEFQLIHCRSYVAAFGAFWAKKKFGIKVLFDIRGFWADERMDGGIWKRTNPIHFLLYNRLKILEKRWFVDADAIISLTERGKKEILEHIQPKVNHEVITVIPCCADENHFDTSRISSSKFEELRNSIGIRLSDVVVSYIGSTGTWYLSDDMLRQFKSLYDREMVTKFLWITNDDITGLKNQVKYLNIPESAFSFVQSSRFEVPYYLSIIDFGIFYILPAYSKIASSPTKLGELLLMGKPIICNSGIGDLDDFFNKNEVGICHEPTTQIEENQLKKLYKNSSAEIRKIGIEQFGLKTGIEKYQGVYQKLNE